MENNDNVNLNTNNNQNFNQNSGINPVPNSTTVLVLGILSITTCICYGIVGLTLGIIALILASKAKVIYDANPNNYFIGSFNNLKAGRICAIIGVSLSALYIVCIIAYILILGAAFSSMPWDTIFSKH